MLSVRHALVGANTKRCSETVPTLLRNNIADSLNGTVPNTVSMSVQRPTLSSGDRVALLRGSCLCRYGAPHSAIRLERHLDGSATAVTSLSAAVYMAVVVNCPVEVLFSVLSAQERHCIVLCDDRPVAISGFHRDVVHIFALLRCYTAYVGSWVPTFRDNISAQY